MNFQIHKYPEATLTYTVSQGQNGIVLRLYSWEMPRVALLMSSFQAISK